MAYRFVDTNCWDDPWYIELNPFEKIMFKYLCDNCDIAGFFELSMKKFRDNLTGMTDDQIKGAFKGLERSYVFSRDKKIIFLKNFCKHQKNVPLNTRNNAHIGIIARIDNYADKFAFDILNLINKGAKKNKKPVNEGLNRGIGKGNGIFNIPFSDFWNLYGYKIGNKKKCEKIWNNLIYDIQKLILSNLAEWKTNIIKIQALPYPETYLNQERWNDEIIIQEAKVKSMFPDHYDKMFESKLSMQQCSQYWKHLHELGYIPKKDRLGNTIDWIKTA